MDMFFPLTKKKKEDKLVNFFTEIFLFNLKEL